LETIRPGQIVTRNSRDATGMGFSAIVAMLEVELMQFTQAHNILQMDCLNATHLFDE
jgi:hypothetical protein